MNVIDSILIYFVAPVVTFLLGGGLVGILQSRRTNRKEDQHDRTTFCEEELAKYIKKTEQQEARITQLEILCINSAVPEWRKNSKGIYVYVSRNFESAILSLSNLTREDVIGKTNYDIFPKEFADKMTRLDNEAKRSLQNIAIRKDVVFPNSEDKMIVIKEIAEDFDGRTYIVGRAYPSMLIKE